MQYDLFQNRVLLHVMGELRKRHRQWADTEKQKISEIPGFKKKAGYIWEYYKLWIIGIVCAVWFFSFAIHQYTTTLHDYWCFMIFSNTYADAGDGSELWNDYVDYAGFDLEEKEVEFIANSYFDYLKGVTGNTYFEAFVAYADGGVLDGIVQGSGSLAALGKTGRLMDLDSEACASIKSKYGDRFIYSDPIDEEYGSDKVAVGIDISDSKLVKKYNIYSMDAALGIGANSENVESVEKFLDFILE